MATNYFLSLGLSPAATEAEIQQAYEQLSAVFKPDNFAGDKAAHSQASAGLSGVIEAKRALSDAGDRAQHAEEASSAGELYKPEQLKPFVGHLCVAAGYIAYSDLTDAISKQTDIDLPLGQILQERRLITQTELEGIVMGQKLYGAPMQPLPPLVKQLLSLGVINLDMVKIVLIDSRTAYGVTLEELLCKRGYLAPSILEALKKG